MDEWINKERVKPKRLHSVAPLVSMTFPSHIDFGLGHETWFG